MWSTLSRQTVEDIQVSCALSYNNVHIYSLECEVHRKKSSAAERGRKWGWWQQRRRCGKKDWWQLFPMSFWASLDVWNIICHGKRVEYIELHYFSNILRCKVFLLLLVQEKAIGKFVRVWKCAAKGHKALKFILYWKR